MGFSSLIIILAVIAISAVLLKMYSKINYLQFYYDAWSVQLDNTIKQLSEKDELIKRLNDSIQMLKTEKDELIKTQNKELENHKNEIHRLVTIHTDVSIIKGSIELLNKQRAILKQFPKLGKPAVADKTEALIIAAIYELIKKYSLDSIPPNIYSIFKEPVDKHYKSIDSTTTVAAP
jgi:hypothetical protein